MLDAGCGSATRDLMLDKKLFQVSSFRFRAAGYSILDTGYREGGKGHVPIDAVVPGPMVALYFHLSATGLRHSRAPFKREEVSREGRRIVSIV